MGNCLRPESSTTWAGEDWSCAMSPKRTKKNVLHKKTKRNKVNTSVKAPLSEDNTYVSSSTKIKLTITRKQLEELLGRLDDIQGLSVEQVFDKLVHNIDQFNMCKRPWRPVLHSIPEDN
ncbi:hypothetical protein IFM89_023308 [Coptis chinensis]|uniref:Uncharacterized protein n=1 Tax=Coptis chinensis TaxID=261450 RepID=A0A835LEY6_9MAGN|nr:hypothetical protein IFM89_023308 [Coptis chinensis]